MKKTHPTNVEAILSIATSRTILSTKSKQIERVQFVFRLCRKDEISFDIVARDGNNVESTFDLSNESFDL